MRPIRLPPASPASPEPQINLKSIIATNTLVVVALLIAMSLLTVTAFCFGGAIREIHKISDSQPNIQGSNVRGRSRSSAKSKPKFALSKQTIA
jgi:hypothetical protein